MSAKEYIIQLLSAKGCFWSNDISIVSPPDSVLMEKGLLYLEFEDMHYLFEVYGFRRLKKFWRENLVSRGEYYSVINWLLALYFFRIKNPDSYLRRYRKVFPDSDFPPLGEDDFEQDREV